MLCDPAVLGECKTGRNVMKIVQAAFVRSIARSLKAQGRSPDLQVIACWQPSRLFLQQWLFACQPARCLQWRDRAGFSPASLFTRQRCEHLRLKRVDANKKGKKRSTSFSWLGVASNLRPPRSKALSATDPSPGLRPPSPQGRGRDPRISAQTSRLQVDVS